MTKDELLARDYDGIPSDVCQAVYDTVLKEKYTNMATDCDDQNLLDWIALSGIKLNMLDFRSGKLAFAFITKNVTSVDDAAKRITLGGQIAFYGLSPIPLRSFFNKPVNFEKWMTVEIPLGDGLFVARRI